MITMIIIIIIIIITIVVVVVEYYFNYIIIIVGAGVPRTLENLLYFTILFASHLLETMVLV